MAQYIDKAAVVAEIEKRKKEWQYGSSIEAKYKKEECDDILYFLDTLEVKEVVSESEQRIKECPYRQVGCTIYADKILECTGACSWVVDHLKLKELKAQKGE